MFNLVKNQKTKSYVILIFLSPLIVTIGNILMVTTFNIGTYTGTFLRYLYHIVVH